MKVLVMGGTRFNGLALVQELVKWGHDVTVLNRGQSEARLPRPVRRLYADRTNHEQLREVLGPEEFDVVQDLSGYALADVQPLVEILRGRIGHYLFGSSTVIYARPKVLPIRESDPVDRSERQTEYGLQKLKVEAYLFDQYRRNGFPATVVPLSMVLGPNNMVADREQRMFQRLLLGRPVLIPGDGTTLSQTGHVDDGAVAMRMLMMQPQTFGKRYNLTGRDYWSDEAYVDTFAEIIGVTPHKVFVPAPVMDDIYAGKGRPVHGPQGRAGHEQGRRLGGRSDGKARPAGGGRARTHPAACAQHPPLERQHLLLGRAAVGGRRVPARVYLRGRGGAHLRLVPERETQRIAAIRLQLGGQPPQGSWGAVSPSEALLSWLRQPTACRSRRTREPEREKWVSRFVRCPCWGRGRMDRQEGIGSRTSPRPRTRCWTW